MDDFDRKLEALLATQALHDGRIFALIRLAELQQENLNRLDGALDDLAAAGKETDLRLQRMAESQRVADDRVSTLVGAIGEFLRRQ